MGLFERFRKGLKKTAQVLNTDIRDLFKQEGRLVDDEFLGDLFAILIKTDMGVGPAEAIRDDTPASNSTVSNVFGEEGEDNEADWWLEEETDDALALGTRIDGALD